MNVQTLVLKVATYEQEEAKEDAAEGQSKWTEYFSGRKLSGIGLANSPVGAVSSTPPSAVTATAASAGYTYPLISNPSLLEDISTSEQAALPLSVSA